MRRQRKVGIRSVVLGQIGSKVPKAAIVGGLNVREPFNQLFGILGGSGDVINHAEAMDKDLAGPLGNARFLGHNVAILHGGPVLLNFGRVPEAALNMLGLLGHEHRVVGV